MLKKLWHRIPISTSLRHDIALLRVSPYLRLHRYVTSLFSMRKSPNFIVIGVQKGGTTSLYNYIVTHSQVGEALTKEIHFYDRYFQRGVGWYLAHFPLTSSGVDLTGEATPSYIFYPDVPAKLAAQYPDIKLILLLRNPIERTFSHYQHRVRYGFEARSFQDAVYGEWKLLDNPNWQDVMVAERRNKWKRYYYTSRGHYAEQIQHWLQHFRSEQLLIIKSEDFFSDTATTFGQVMTFLGLKIPMNIKFKSYNQGNYTDEIEPKFREELRRYFAPHNEALKPLVPFSIEDWH